MRKLTFKDKNIGSRCVSIFYSKNLVTIFSYLLRVLSLIKMVTSYSTSSENRLSCKLIYLTLHSQAICLRAYQRMLEHSPLLVRNSSACVSINIDLFNSLVHKRVYHTISRSAMPGHARTCSNTDSNALYRTVRRYIFVNDKKSRP